jgi:hypothetical protein
MTKRARFSPDQAAGQDVVLTDAEAGQILGAAAMGSQRAACHLI